jgi:dimethylamine monooxygenase subunit C
MADPTIKSRPVYRGLSIAPHARRHVFALEGEGALALQEQVETSDRAFLSRAEIFYVARGSQPRAHAAMLSALGPAFFWEAPSVATLLARLRATLTTATMGTRIYVAGTENFIGQALQVAMEFGVDPASVATEHRGSLARRVQCVHCKGITDDVTTTPYTCTHCGLALFVRDHYSRRIGAFQGVNVDAEVPGSVPPSQELYP